MKMNQMINETIKTGSLVRLKKLKNGKIQESCLKNIGVVYSLERDEFGKPIYASVIFGKIIIEKCLIELFEVLKL